MLILVKSRAGGVGRGSAGARIWGVTAEGTKRGSTRGSTRGKAVCAVCRFDFQQQAMEVPENGGTAESEYNDKRIPWYKSQHDSRRIYINSYNPGDLEQGKD